MFGFNFKIHFDVNEWLRERKGRKIRKLQSICPHAYFQEENGKYIIKFFVSSPSGTLQWQCQRCGAIFATYPTHLDDMVPYWLKNPKKLNKQNKKADKLIKKIHG